MSDRSGRDSGRRQSYHPLRRTRQLLLAPFGVRISRRVQVVRALVAIAWMLAMAVTLVPPMDSGLVNRVVGGVALVVLALLALLAAYSVNRTISSNYAGQLVHLEQLASTDDLTGLANRRTFMRRLTEECQRAERYRRPLSIVLIDMDQFKLINDQHGHATGDHALVNFGALLSSTARVSDLVARLGGDEFALLLPETDDTAAARMVERLRALLQSQPLVVIPERNLRLTAAISAGIARSTPDARCEEKLLADADAALYEDKRLRVREATHTSRDEGWRPRLG